MIPDEVSELYAARKDVGTAKEKSYNSMMVTYKVCPPARPPLQPMPWCGGAMSSVHVLAFGWVSAEGLSPEGFCE